MNIEPMLLGKTVLVTGGSGAIGAAIVRAVAQHGGRPAFTYYRQEEKAQALLSELRGAGVDVIAGRVNAVNPSEVEGFAGEVEKTGEGIDVLVNNIGAAQVMPFALIDAADWDEAMQINLKSMFLFSKAVVRGMIRRRRGAIVNMGSIAGQRLLEVPVHYATAKAGVVGFTLSLAKELCRYQIRVNAVLPGLIDGGIGSNVSERQLEEFKRYNACGRTGTPAEVAELCCFLGSNRASYINAQCLSVDGGI